MGVAPTVDAGFSPAAIADSFFFGDAGTRTYKSFSSGYTSSWTSAAIGADNKVAFMPIVSLGTVVGVSSPGITDPGRVFGYNKSTGATNWTYLTGTNDLASVSAVTAAPDGNLYFTDSANSELVARTFAGGGSTASASGSPCRPVVG